MQDLYLLDLYPVDVDLGCASLRGRGPALQDAPSRVLALKVLSVDRGGCLEFGVQFLVPVIRDVQLQAEPAQGPAIVDGGGGGQLHGREFADRTQQPDVKCRHHRLPFLPCAWFFVWGGRPSPAVRR
ncbi:hypothetical protein EDD92_0204 [Streptomyces sp. TLI_185]|nr:hypothetical protein EDD92_0204 [Streptomyces sp. TLI_185]